MPPERHPNQHKPTPDLDTLLPLVQYFWSLGLSGRAIVEHVREHIDLSKYGFSYNTYRRRMAEWGFRSVRKQAHTMESIQAAVTEIHWRYPEMGARAIVAHLRENYNDMRVPEKVVLDYLRLTEPLAVMARKFRRFKRRQFWVAGVNDVWCFDQHDKMKRFGLYFHCGFEPASGRILWMRVWWTNRNPRLVTSYYLQAARNNGGVPLVTQSDPGSENIGIANCHTHIRHELDPSLVNTRQHRWMRMKANIKPEIVWSVLRRQWSPGFENCLTYGLLNGFYDPDNPLEKLLFLWLAVPWLQKELDSWVNVFNRTKRRADKHKILPQGIPDLVAANPEKYKTLDFKVVVDSALLDRMQALWAPPDHAVFQLVPPVFATIAQTMYQTIGAPVVDRGSFWEVYLKMRAVLTPDLLNQFQEDIRTRDKLEEEEMALLDGLQEMRFGGHGPLGLYAGGAVHPPVSAEIEKWYESLLDKGYNPNLQDGELGEGEGDADEDEEFRLYADFSDDERDADSGTDYVEASFTVG